MELGIQYKVHYASRSSCATIVKKFKRTVRRFRKLHFYIITEMHQSGISNAPIICQLGRALTQFVFRLLQHRQIFRCKCCDLHSLVPLVM